MALGLLYILASLAGGIFLAYVLFQVLIPMSTIIDTVAHGLMIKFGIDPKWMSVYNNYLQYMGEWEAILLVGMVIAMVVWAIANAVRKESTMEEYEV